eukprot:TRINITY_DN6470_c0_g1_i1.p2 TRINITY_DN6470_c0_g1~~TRINITY_DN6470_c0_g1_i1.p2  ORF type:complete len:151 (-),score=11.09 TRINITY_DN6470_c0_g1_i1:112-564(-)
MSTPRNRERCYEDSAFWIHPLAPAKEYSYIKNLIISHGGIVMDRFSNSDDDRNTFIVVHYEWVLRPRYLHFSETSLYNCLAQLESYECDLILPSALFNSLLPPFPPVMELIASDVGHLHMFDLWTCEQMLLEYADEMMASGCCSATRAES